MEGYVIFTAGNSASVANGRAGGLVQCEVAFEVGYSKPDCHCGGLKQTDEADG